MKRKNNERLIVKNLWWRCKYLGRY